MAASRLVKSSEIAAGQAEANEQAKKIRTLEITRNYGYSKPRLLLTLTHKYGYSPAEAEEAVKHLVRLGLAGNVSLALNPQTQMKQPMGGAVDYPEDQVPNEYDDRNNDVTESHGTSRVPTSYRTEVEGDLRPSNPSMPQFTPGTAVMARTLISAQIRLTADTIMARATAVTRVAEKGIKAIEHELLKRGFYKHTVQNRAFYTTTFTKETEDGKAHVLQLMGWHGTGRFAGGEKTILEFYDEDKSNVKPVVSIGPISEDNINPAKQLETIQHVLEYIDKNTE